MAGTLSIRWASAARFAGLSLGAVAALAFLVSALEPPAPAAIPADVGLGVHSAEPAAPQRAAEPSRPGSWTLAWPSPPGADARPEPVRGGPRKPPHSRSRRPPRPDRTDERDEPAPVAPAPAAAPPETTPQAVTYAPTPSRPAPAPAAPAPPPPNPPEFGFER
jgi:hypothetical protein